MKRISVQKKNDNIRTNGHFEISAKWKDFVQGNKDDEQKKKKKAVTCEENIILKSGDFTLIQRWILTSSLDLNIP